MKQGGANRASAGVTMAESHKRFGGFTIAETLIVLAVTGALLAIAIVFISGRQDKTLFMTAINNLQQQVQQIINETSSGFPGSTSFNCQGKTDSTQPTINPKGTGTNGGCIFLGKVIQFGVHGDNNTGHLVVYPIVGNQQVRQGVGYQQVQSLADAAPVAAVNSPSVDASTTVALDNGLRVHSSATTNAYGVGFITSFSSYNGNDLNSGSQQFSLYKIQGIGAEATPTAAVGAIDTLTNFVPATSDLAVCIDSGTTNESAVLTISSGSLAVSLKIRENQAC